MAAPSVWENWTRSADAPLRPCDLPSRAAMERLWDDTEQAVFDSAFAPGAGEYRPPQWPKDRARSVDETIFDEVMRGL